MTGWSVPFPISIWRMSLLTDTEATLTDNEEIGMSDGFSEEARFGCYLFNWKLSNRSTDLGQPASRGLSKPDTGLGNLELVIGIKINIKTAWDQYELILTKWGLEKQVIKGQTEKGRFGIRNDTTKFPNLNPSATAGWKMVENSSQDVVEYGGIFDILLTFQFAGDPAELVTKMNTYIT